MKRVRVNEHQINRLFEMRSEKFTFKNLSMLRGNWEKQYDYCCKTLGDAMGFGTARCVFPFNENMVLKLAIGSRRREGIEQNKNEYLNRVIKRRSNEIEICNACTLSRCGDGSKSTEWRGE